MDKFFDNLESIAERLEQMIANGDALPDGAALKVSEFNERIQKLEASSARLKSEKKD